VKKNEIDHNKKKGNDFWKNLLDLLQLGFEHEGNLADSSSGAFQEEITHALETIKILIDLLDWGLDVWFFFLQSS
jgi:hypothetical protein